MEVCSATTKKGTPCTRKAKNGYEFCHIHLKVKNIDVSESQKATAKEGDEVDDSTLPKHLRVLMKGATIKSPKKSLHSNKKNISPKKTVVQEKKTISPKKTTVQEKKIISPKKTTMMEILPPSSEEEDYILIEKNNEGEKKTHKKIDIENPPKSYKISPKKKMVLSPSKRPPPLSNRTSTIARNSVVKRTHIGKISL